jgi:hypothetical protein
MKTWEGVEAYLSAFLILAQDGRDWSASHISRFTSRKTAPFALWIGNWLDPIAGLVKMKLKCLEPTGSRTPISQEVKLSLCLIKHHGMRMYGRSAILNLNTKWRWVVSFIPGNFTARERARCIHWIGDWVVPEPVWHTAGSRNPAIQPVPISIQTAVSKRTYPEYGSEIQYVSQEKSLTFLFERYALKSQKFHYSDHRRFSLGKANFLMIPKITRPPLP